eukprot:13675103-Alexandrium_andersonii.AAC.1
MTLPESYLPPVAVALRATCVDKDIACEAAAVRRMAPRNTARGAQNQAASQRSARRVSTRAVCRRRVSRSGRVAQALA